ncbi:MAG: TetR/AcrR family transcriptional regulator [Acidimicrobiales bacterium]|nr:TetR/AcrR family transcriptional regulator [Acidimicrobiales bacterium]
MSTRQRVIDAALRSFGGRGYDATSLDALAAELGIRKQSILYHFSSKEVLLDAVVDEAVSQVGATMTGALATVRPPGGAGWPRTAAIVRAVFGLATRRPELLGLLREVARPDHPALARAVRSFEPLVEDATAFLAAEMDAGRYRRCDPRLLLVSVYSTVMGVANEVEVLRAVGIEATAREAVVRRRELLRFLRCALVPDTVEP